MIPSALSKSCPVCGREGPKPFLSGPDRFHGTRAIYRLVQCPTCALVWLDDPPAPDEIGIHYGADYDRSVAKAGNSPGRWEDRVKFVRQYATGGALLDLGCSNGGFMKSLQGPTWTFFGIEMSDPVAKLAEEATGARVFVGDILDAPYPPESFDVITCFHVFEHLYQPRQVMEKVAYWLKPGGIFFAMMPNIHSTGAKVFGSYWYALELPRHLYHFSPSALSQLAQSVGLENLSIATHRELFVESSVRYLFDEALQRLGHPRTPLARAEPPGVPFRIARKGFRLMVLPILDVIANFIGDGESIHAVLQKPVHPKRVKQSGESMVDAESLQGIG